MNKSSQIAIFILRFLMGWIFLYSGASKILSGTWSAAGYLKTAKTFPGFFAWFASPENIGWVTLLNEWGMLLIGISLVLGVMVRWSSLASLFLMVLYYLPAFKFPYASEHYLFVDDHVIYFFLFVFFIVAEAGEYMGLDKWYKNRRPTV